MATTFSRTRRFPSTDATRHRETDSGPRQSCAGRFHFKESFLAAKNWHGSCKFQLATLPYAKLRPRSFRTGAIFLTIEENFVRIPRVFPMRRSPAIILARCLHIRRCNPSLCQLGPGASSYENERRGLFIPVLPRVFACTAWQAGRRPPRRVQLQDAKESHSEIA